MTIIHSAFSDSAPVSGAFEQTDENKENKVNKAPDQGLVSANGKQAQQPRQLHEINAQDSVQQPGVEFVEEPGEDIGQQQKEQQEEKGEGCDMGGMTDEMLLEVFKATSAFNVKSALANNEYLMHAADDMFGRDAYEINGDEDWQEFRGFWSDDEDWDGGKRFRKRGRRERKEGVEDRERDKVAGAGKALGVSGSYAKPKQHMVSESLLLFFLQ